MHPYSAILSYASFVEGAKAGPHFGNRRESRVTELAQKVCQSALTAAPAVMKDDLGLYFGISFSRAEFVRRAGEIAETLDLKNYVESMSFANSIAAAVTGHVAKTIGIHGPSLVINSGRLSALDALGLAHARVTAGAGSAILAGGMESASAVNWSSKRPLSEIESQARSSAAVVLLGAPGHAAPELARLIEYRSVKEAPQACLVATAGAANIDPSQLVFVAFVGDDRTHDLVDVGVLSPCCQVLWTCECPSTVGTAEGAIGCILAIQALEKPEPEPRFAAVLACDESGQSACLIVGASFPSANDSQLAI